MTTVSYNEANGATSGYECVMKQEKTMQAEWAEPKEPFFRGTWNRFLQLLARAGPGEDSLRPMLHRARGVKIGKKVRIGYDVVLETARPDLISIGDGVSIGMRATIIAHFKETHGVRIGHDVFIGPGAIILPNVTIGDGAVIKAGTIVSQSIPPMTVVQGNPAVPVARCETPLRQDVTLRTFSKGIKPLASAPTDRKSD